MKSLYSHSAHNGEAEMSRGLQTLHPCQAYELPIMQHALTRAESKTQGSSPTSWTLTQEKASCISRTCGKGQFFDKWPRLSQFLHVTFLLTE